MFRWVIDGFDSSAVGRSSPRDFNITSSPQALCVNAQRCPHGAQAAQRPERVGGPGEGIGRLLHTACHLWRIDR